MAQRIEHGDFPSTMSITPGGALGGIVGQTLYFTALEDALWVGIGPDMYGAKIEWRNVGHVVRWLQTQNRKNK